MPTPRLYWDDPLLLAFDATVVAHADHGKRRGFVLDRTAFYPEAGGQLADRGRATWDGGSLVLDDAQEDAEGRVVHLAEGALPDVGARVAVTVDAARRRAHMSQHTGQHLLSRLLLDVAGGATASSRLGEDACSIDTPLESLDPSALAEAVRRANVAVLEDRPVRAHFPTPETLAAMPLRREPKVTDNVRVIEIEGLDFSPCGGTHCTATGQIGAIHVDAVERHKGGLRLTFRTGLRALELLSARDAALRDLSRSLTCGWDELAGVVGKMRADLAALRKEHDLLQLRVAHSIADGLAAQRPAEGGGWIVAGVEGGASMLRAVADRLAELPGVAALLWSAEGEAFAVVAVRGAGSNVDAGVALRAVAASLGGKGGGRPTRAEGRVPTRPDPEQARKVLNSLTNS